jgi:RsiW-degrading membrane proteinase PrsW (M82 family)
VRGEALKALVLVALIRANRIAFLVDAAIFGFAVGAGFALVENLYFLGALRESHYAIWVVRGFGTRRCTAACRRSSRSPSSR